MIGPVGEVRTEVDEVDLALLRALQDDGRAPMSISLRSLVFRGRSAATRRTSRRSQVVRVAQSSALRSGSAERDRFRGAPRGDHRDVVEQLGDDAVVDLRRAHARSLRRARYRGAGVSVAQLGELLDQVRALAGVHAVESWAHLEVVKESTRLGWMCPLSRKMRNKADVGRPLSRNSAETSLRAIGAAHRWQLSTGSARRPQTVSIRWMSNSCCGQVGPT